MMDIFNGHEELRCVQCEQGPCCIKEFRIKIGSCSGENVKWEAKEETEIHYFTCECGYRSKIKKFEYYDGSYLWGFVDHPKNVLTCNSCDKYHHHGVQPDKLGNVISKEEDTKEIEESLEDTGIKPKESVCVSSEIDIDPAFPLKFEEEYFAVRDKKTQRLWDGGDKSWEGEKHNENQEWITDVHDCLRNTEDLARVGSESAKDKDGNPADVEIIGVKIICTRVLK